MGKKHRKRRESPINLDYENTLLYLERAKKLMTPFGFLTLLVRIKGLGYASKESVEMAREALKKYSER